MPLKKLLASLILYVFEIENLQWFKIKLHVISRWYTTLDGIYIWVMTDKFLQLRKLSIIS